jgi:hypothetical protein
VQELGRDEIIKITTSQFGRPATAFLHLAEWLMSAAGKGGIICTFQNNHSAKTGPTLLCVLPKGYGTRDQQCSSPRANHAAVGWLQTAFTLESIFLKFCSCAVEIHLNVGYCSIFKNIIYNIVALIRSDHRILIGRLRIGQIHNTVATMTKFRGSHPIHDRVRFESGPIDHYNTELVLSYTALLQSFSFNYSGRR